MDLATFQVIPDLIRVAAIVLFAMFVGGAIRILLLYRRKNAVYRRRTGGPRPMFKHVVRVSLGTLLAAISAITNNVERIGDGFSVYLPLNFFAMYFLWTAMVSMMEEATHRRGWLKPEVDDLTEARIMVLNPDLTIRGATTDYLRMVERDRSIIGKHVFDAFPDPQADQAGKTALSTSLEIVRETLKPHQMEPLEYPIQLPDGTWETRFWQVVNIPVLDGDGHIDHIINRVSRARNKKIQEQIAADEIADPENGKV